MAATRPSAPSTQLPKPLQLADEISGWLTKTHEGNLTAKDEPFTQRFYRLDLHSGILSEFQDNHKSRKLTEHLLLRRMTHIEVNFSNKLREEHAELFSRYGCRLPKNFRLPSAKELHPIAIHFIDGGLMIMWTPVHASEFDKWLAALN